MASSVDPSVYQRTRETMGKVIKKPPLTDKLLAKPPFRYLHDIISEVSKQTQFFKGLYSAQELNAKTITERDDKVAFLQKAIDTLSFTTGEMVKVRPSKVVAGHEADKTNEFLQIMAISIMKELDSSEAVRRVLSGDKPSNSLGRDKRKRSKEAKADRKSRSRSRDKQHSKDGEGSGALKSKSHRSLKDTADSASRPTHRPSRTRPPPDPQPSEQEGPPDSQPSEQGGPPDPQPSEQEGPSPVEAPVDTRLDRPSSAKGSRRRQQPSSDSDNEAIEPPEEIRVSAEAPPPTQPMMSMKRPGSARPAPPKVIQSTSEEVISRVPSGGMRLEAPPTVILDSSDHEDDDQFMVQDANPLEAPDSQAFLPPDPALHDEPEGALTKNIVAMKEHLEGGVPKSEPEHLPSLTQAQRHKEREAVAKEIEKLQSSIQTLCQSANPLGKIMDYVQEDMDSMQKELEMWRQENSKHTDSLRNEERITEQELAPLRALLEDLEGKVREQADLISASKATIVHNDGRMQQMLGSITLVS